MITKGAEQSPVTASHPNADVMLAIRQPLFSGGDRNSRQGQVEK